MALKHNKKKNGRIVYEQLMTLATRLAMEEYISESKHILEIVKEHFAPNTMLGKEKKLFDAILETKISSKTDAEAVLAEALSETRLMNEKKLEQEKINLINRILTEVGKDLFALPIKQFKLIASAQILFNEMRNNFKYSDPQERVKIKNIIVENMNNVPEPKEEYEMDNFTYKILVKKFDQKYFSVMNEDQKEILTGWINFLITEDSEKFKDLLKKKTNKAKGQIDNSLIKQQHKESEYSVMLKEAREQLGKASVGTSEEDVHQIMRYFDLVEDLRELENG